VLIWGLMFQVDVGVIAIWFWMLPNLCQRAELTHRWYETVFKGSIRREERRSSPASTYPGCWLRPAGQWNPITRTYCRKNAQDTFKLVALVCATSFMDGWCGPWSCTVVIRSRGASVVNTIMTAPASLLSTLISGSVSERPSQFVHETIVRRTRDKTGRKQVIVVGRKSSRNDFPDEGGSQGSLFPRVEPSRAPAACA
jgi:hypothetical protein